MGETPLLRRKYILLLLEIKIVESGSRVERQRTRGIWFSVRWLSGCHESCWWKLLVKAAVGPLCFSESTKLSTRFSRNFALLLTSIIEILNSFSNWTPTRCFADHVVLTSELNPVKHPRSVVKGKMRNTQSIHEYICRDEQKTAVRAHRLKDYLTKIPDI